MRSTPSLVSATPTDGYGVQVDFEDGTAAVVDLSYLTDRGGVFAPLQDVEYFRRLRADVEAGTIVWPNDADIAPETLYAHALGRQAATA
ncbi:MAG: DUF2442 domain-containing protein [Candidatus Limnocylindria bacterium]